MRNVHFFTLHTLPITTMLKVQFTDYFALWLFPTSLNSPRNRNLGILNINGLHLSDVRQMFDFESIKPEIAVETDRIEEGC